MGTLGSHWGVTGDAEGDYPVTDPVSGLGTQWGVTGESLGSHWGVTGESLGTLGETYLTTVPVSGVAAWDQRLRR